MNALPVLIGRLLCFVAVYAGLVAPCQAGAAPREGSECAVKRGFVYNFIAFTQWPAGSFADGAAPIIVCVVPDDPITDIFLDLSGRTVQGRKIVVRKTDTLASCDRVHVLFLATGDSDLVRTCIESVQGKPVLTIGQAADFLAMGGMIHLYTQDDHLRFAVDIGAARREHLKPGSQILMSAETVTGADR